MRFRLLLLVVCVTRLCPGAFAQDGITRDVRTLDLEAATQQLSRYDLEPKGFWFDGNAFQFGFGLRAANYITERIYFPVSIFATQLPGGDDFFYFMAGLGYDCEIAKDLSVQASLNAGVAAFENDNAAFALEPVAGLAYRPWRWLRIGGSVSYLSLAEGLPGAWTAALSLQFKMFSLVWPE